MRGWLVAIVDVNQCVCDSNYFALLRIFIFFYRSDDLESPVAKRRDMFGSRSR